MKTIKNKLFNKSPWLRSHKGAMQRCIYKSNANYYKYGGKGIKFLMTKDDFKFLWFRDKAYLMKRPSIDRIDSKGHYTLENCRYMELRDNVKRPYTAHCHKHRRTHRVINDFKGCVFKQPFSNHYSYGKFGMTIHRKSIAITEYGGYEKNDQNKQYIEIPTRYLRQMIKFYLKKGLQPNDPR